MQLSAHLPLLYCLTYMVPLQFYARELSQPSTYKVRKVPRRRTRAARAAIANSGHQVSASTHMDAKPKSRFANSSCPIAESTPSAPSAYTAASHPPSGNVGTAPRSSLRGVVAAAHPVRRE